MRARVCMGGNVIQILLLLVLAENEMLHKAPSKCDPADDMNTNSTEAHIPVDSDQYEMNSSDRVVSAKDVKTTQWSI